MSVKFEKSVVSEGNQSRILKVKACKNNKFFIILTFNCIQAHVIATMKHTGAHMHKHISHDTLQTYDRTQGYSNIPDCQIHPTPIGTAAPLPH